MPSMIVHYSLRGKLADDYANQNQYSLQEFIKKKWKENLIERFRDEKHNLLVVYYKSELHSLKKGGGI